MPATDKVAHQLHPHLSIRTLTCACDQHGSQNCTRELATAVILSATSLRAATLTCKSSALTVASGHLPPESLTSKHLCPNKLSPKHFSFSNCRLLLLLLPPSAIDAIVRDHHYYDHYLLHAVHKVVVRWPPAIMTATLIITTHGRHVLLPQPPTSTGKPELNIQMRSKRSQAVGP